MQNGSLPTGPFSAQKKLSVGILGTGSIGGFIGGLLQAQGNCHVVFLGRQRLWDEMNAAGKITLTSYAGLQTSCPLKDVNFTTDIADLLSCDVILSCVKCLDVASTISQLAAARRAQILDKPDSHPVVLVPLQNGVRGAADVRDALGPMNSPDHFNVIGGIVGFGVAWVGEAKFHRSTDGDIFLEEHIRTDISNALINGLTQTALGAPVVSKDMEGTMYGKLLVNFINPINAISGTNVGTMLDIKDYRLAWGASVSEGLAVLDRAGIKPASVLKLPIRLLPSLIGSTIVYSLIRRVQKTDNKGYSSMAQDIQKGRKTEIESLNGVIVELAKKMNMASPVNSKIVEIIHDIEAGKIKSMSGSQLAQAVGVKNSWPVIDMIILTTTVVAAGVCFWYFWK